ncbi:uncharacterized protein LOC112047551 [Bicyclus anynana]|uniref:Uncharacterized protein LOC112047551 n=1 Tax=Bicyclus anynana TaxID=110368 RepID=A0A6J1N0T2_BICAN|nr:uncharacterized protein LOC112047551 [Bicyclus anynana]
MCIYIIYSPVRLARRTLLSTSLALAICAIGVTVYGAYIMKHMGQIEEHRDITIMSKNLQKSPYHLQNFPLGVMAVGHALFLFFLCGPFVLRSDKSNAFYLYGFALLGMGITCCLTPNIIRNIAENFLDELDTPELEPTLNQEQFLEVIQFYAQCCGVTRRDFNSTFHPSELPMTCCPSWEWVRLKSENHKDCPWSDAYEAGCRDAIIETDFSQRIFVPIGLVQVYAGMAAIYLALDL